MKKILILLSGVLLLLNSCKKKDTCPYTESGLSASTVERSNLTTYLSANSLTATEHTSGVFYNITTQGTGANPTICSNITVKYKGTLIPAGTVFDSTPAGSSTSFTLGELIVGWQKVLPLLKMGGKITLYIPPFLGYGSQPVKDNAGNIVIPANAYLTFEIELVNVQ